MTGDQDIEGVDESHLRAFDHAFSRSLELTHSVSCGQTCHPGRIDHQEAVDTVQPIHLDMITITN